MDPYVPSCAGRAKRPAHTPLLRAGIAAALTFTALPAATPAYAQTAAYDIQDALKAEGGKKDVRAFYKARDYRPLWIRNGAISADANRLVALIEDAHLDGLNRKRYDLNDLIDALVDARSGDPKDLAEAEMRLSRALADFARDVAAPPKSGMHYVDKELVPEPLTRRAALEAAAAAPSLTQFIDGFGWMNPGYGKLRASYAANAGRLTDAQRRIVAANLNRLRMIPADPGNRYVLVDAAAQRLFMYENGRVKDTMKVVVGKESQQTPMMAGLIRFASVNPYWNVPPDLVAERIAPNVLRDGLSYLDDRGYEILSNWTDSATPINPSRIDWNAVASGRQHLRVRQKPGPANAMGRMKFMFPNQLGVYLHDTPDKDLFGNTDRRVSAGCVRLEDAPRLARWLFGKPIRATAGSPEQQVNLPKPVPVYITYLTAAPENGRIAFREDIYNRDGVRLAGAGVQTAARR